MPVERSVLRSARRTRAPLRESSRAACSPASPAPIMTTSNSRILIGCVVLKLGRAAIRLMQDPVVCPQLIKGPFASVIHRPEVRQLSEFAISIMKSRSEFAAVFLRHRRQRPKQNRYRVITKLAVIKRVKFAALLHKFDVRSRDKGVRIHQV